MRIGIDASNIRGSGGVTHLVELLRAAEPQEHGFERVIVWASSATLARLDERPWLRKAHQPALDRSLPARFYWQRYKLDRLARRERCDLVFVPGGTYSGAFRPFVTMSQNLLPFEWSEARRFGISWPAFRYLLLRKSQLATFKRAEGMIFLSEYARQAAGKLLNGSVRMQAVIPHGVDERFRRAPRRQTGLDCYSPEKPYRFLYVSIINFYKHQWHVAEAVGRLRTGGLPVAVDFVGPAYGPALRRFEDVTARWDPRGKDIRYLGPIEFGELHHVYHLADGFVFASSCENLPIILLEAMAAGLPIACSNRGPMPAILGEAGTYFDPERPGEIAESLHALLADPGLRETSAWVAYERAKSYTWPRCARDTFDFLNSVRCSQGTS